MGPGCACSLSEQHHPGRRPENRPKPTGRTVRAPLAGRPSPELAGNVPRTDRRRYVLIRPVTTRSCGSSSLCLRWRTLRVCLCGVLRVFGYLLCCVLLDPWSSLVVSAWTGLFSCQGQPASHLHRQGHITLVPLFFVVTAASQYECLYPEIEETMRSLLGVTSRSSLLDHA